MDRKEIIEEGLLEQYLLGELTAEQQALVETALAKDGDLKKQYQLMEEDFEKVAFENAIDPPTHIRTSLEQTLSIEASDDSTRSLDVAASQKKSLTIRLMTAASLAAVFALSCFWLYNQWQNAEQNIEQLQQQTSGLQQRLTDLEKNYDIANENFRTINNPDVIPFVLLGNQIAPDAKAVAYVNHTTKNVVVNPQGLPDLPTDKTYQMWADVDGEMIDMGVIPTDRDLVALKYIDEAESLNITIEPAGGNDHPTVENLISNILL